MLVSEDFKIAIQKHGIEIKLISNYESDKTLLQGFEITSLQETFMLIQLNFTDPFKVSTSVVSFSFFTLGSG